MISKKNHNKLCLRAILYCSIALLLFFAKVEAQNLINIKGGARISFAAGSVVRINGGLATETGSALSANGLATVEGDWTVAGSQTAASGAVRFVGSGNSVINCSGLNAQFYLISIAKNGINAEVKLIAPIITTGSFLDLLSGTFNIDGEFAFNSITMNPTIGEIVIPTGARFILNNSLAVISAQPANYRLLGETFIRKGELRIGDGSAEYHLLYGNGSKLEIGPDESAKLIVGSSIMRANNNDSISYNQSGGLVRLGTTHSSTQTGRGLFDIGADSSSFSMSGGVIEFKKASTTATDEFYVKAAKGSVTGGKLSVSADASGAVFSVNSTKPIGGLEQISTNNPQIQLASNLSVVGDVTLAGTGSARLNFSNYDLSVGGNWTNNLVSSDGVAYNNRAVKLIGSGTQKLQGTAALVFPKLFIDKTGGKTEMYAAMTIQDTLRLVSNAALDMKSYNLTIEQNGAICSDYGSQQSLSSFSVNKYIINSGAVNDTVTGASLIRKINPAKTAPFDVNFPVGTPNSYTPGVVTINMGGATLAAGAQISMNPVPTTHPAAEIPNRSMSKYWVVKKQNITLNDNGATLQFYYNPAEVQGNEGNYEVLYYSPSWNDPSGYWRVNPGESDDVVDFNAKLFYSMQVDEIDGDWLAGEPSVAKAIYFSRADGLWSDTTTWSKEGFDGAIANKVPSRLSDVVRIQGHTVTITSQPGPVNKISVETGVSPLSSGKLVIAGSAYITGDTFKLEPNAMLTVQHPDGFSASPGLTGAIRATSRNYNSSAIYEYSGSSNQTTGDGVPDAALALVVTKTSTSKLTLTKNVSIIDSLVINDGSLDMSLFTLNGQTSGRTFVMRGGELIVPSAFPLNYSAPTFSAGTINFRGTGNVSIPSSGSSPGVAQYYDLKISNPAGQKRAGNVTLRSLGEIRVSNNLDISTLEFNDNSYRFFADGSTVRFNKSGGTQSVQTRPALPPDTVCYLNYYKLIINGGGTKNLYASTGSPLFKILNELKIEGGSTLSANGYDMEVQGNWINQSGVFIPGANTVIMRSPVATYSTILSVRDTTDNPFNNLLIAGAGEVYSQDNLLVRGNLTIDSSSIFKFTDKSLTVGGNWTNRGGAFNYGTSTVIFNGSVQQTATNPYASINYYNLYLRNPKGLVAQSIGTTQDNGINVYGSLNLDSGKIDSRNKLVTVYGAVTRGGGGYVNGALAKPIPAGASTVNFEIGYNSRYTPATLNISGSGGGVGALALVSDTVTNSTSPISWNAGGTNILPTGHTLSFPKHIRRQWAMRVPAGSAFSLGARSYSATLEFVGASSPGDLYNSADPQRFEARLLTLSNNWIKPYQLGEKPFVSSRTQNSLVYAQLDTIGTIIVGEPGIQTYYARKNGNWTDPTSWSTIGYGGGPAGDYPSQNNDIFTAYVGAGYTIDLDTNGINVDNTGLIQIDSSGRLNCGTNVLTGAGEFRLMKYSTLGIGHTSGIQAAPAMAGNIQTTTRNYNQGNHDRAKLVYNGTVAQTQPNSGVPATLATLSIEKTGGSQLTWDMQNVTINDSLRIMNGAFQLGSNVNCNIALNGNMRRGSGAVFTPNNRRITIQGAVEDTIYNEDATPIPFDTLELAKPNGSGFVVLWDNTPIIVNTQLRFTAPIANKLLIDARSRNGNYVQIGQNGTVQNAGIGKGWVDGEMRRWVPAGATTVRWEIGDTARYNPFEFQFISAGGSGNGTAGYVGAQMIVGEHTFHQPQISHSIAVGRTVGPKFWRLTKPTGSAFDRGARTYNTNIYFYWPEDGKNIDGWACAELSYLRRWSVDTNWVKVWPSNNVNSGSAGYLCTDTRNLSRTPNYNYTGALTGGLANVMANAMNSDFGSDQMIGSNLLLGDFIVGNQDSLKKFYNYYSIKDGDWNDPSTWSTVSYNSTVNAAAIDPDPLITGVPRRQYDNAYIGNGKKVVLTTNIGTNQFSSAEPLNTMLGPSVVVQNTGALDFNYHTLRGNTFSLEKGGKVFVGSISGVSFTSGWGNVIPQDRRPAFIDSSSFVFTAQGYTTEIGTLIPNGQVNRNSTAYYIEKVIIKSQAGDTVMYNRTQDTLTRNSFGINPYLDYKATLSAGQTYTVLIDPSTNAGVNRRYKVYLNYDYNGSYEDSTETVLDVNSAADTLFTLGSFTVPAWKLHGSTQMRVCMNNSTGNFNSNSNGTGEFEEYTVDIINPNTTITQVTGNGLPSNLASLEIKTAKAASTVTLGKNITVRDSLRITSGQLLAGANTIALTGDFVNEVSGGFNAGTGTFRFINTDNSRVRGTQSIRFYTLNMDKTPNLSRVDMSVPISVQNRFNYNNANVLSITNPSTLTFENTCTFSNWNNFGPKKMIRLTGDTLTNGKVTAQFTTAAGSKPFTFPIGIDTIYNPAIIAVTGSYSGTPSISASVVGSRHPEKLTGAVSMLKKYWKIATTGISNITADSVNLTYHWRDTAGNANKYLPGVYLVGGPQARKGWEVNLGQNPSAKPFAIRAQNVQNEVTIDGDWTAAEPKTYFGGRQFYSIANGNWKSPTSWSNFGHNSTIIASYYPGQIFPDDTVYVDGYKITFDADTISVDTISVGGTNPIVAQGELYFPATPATKTLSARQFVLQENAKITQDTVVANRADTISIKQKFANTSSVGIDFRKSATNYTALRFEGSGASEIAGEGAWGELGEVIVKKSGGLADSLFITSKKFSDATMIQVSPKIRFTLGGGVIKHSANDTLNLSGLNQDVPMASGSGVTVDSGIVNIYGSLFTNSNTAVHIRGGTLNVGDSLNENIKYATGTTIQIDKGALNVAGCISRSLITSSLNFGMNGGEARVLTKGNSNAADIGFDMTTAASSLSLTGGRLIIANGGGSTPSDADIRLNAAFGSGISGTSVLQIGDSLLTPNGAIIKISGNMPLKNLHLANRTAYAVTTRLTEEVYQITNNFDVDFNHTFQLNGNTLKLGGSLSNWGTFAGTPAASTTLPWLVELNGAGDQTLFNNGALGLELFNLKINKPSGTVSLFDAATSFLKVTNQLEFAAANAAILIAPNSTSVTIEPKSGIGIADILRSGLGHISGRLYRHTPAGANIEFFPVGSDTLSSYRPIWIQTYAGNNVAGLLGVKAFSTGHPDTANAEINTSTNILQWWNLQSPATGGYSLGTTKYAVTTQFLNPRDLRGAAPIVSEHFRRTPAWNASPATWFKTETTEKTDSTLKSINHTAFGDIIIGEPRGVTFFAWTDNGEWTNPATWSHDGYTTRTTPVTRWPNLNTDVVRIGNGKRVVIPDGAPPIAIKQTVIERYAGLPGTLAIKGNLGYIRGKNFLLEDSCTVEIENVQGIKPYTETNNGAIQTEYEPVWGVGRFVYNSSYGNQSVGLGIPQNVKTLVIDNQNILQDTVFLTSYVGIPNLNVRDTLLIKRGRFLVSDRNLTLNRAMALDSSVRNGSLIAQNNHMATFTGASDYYLVLNNNTGVTFRNLRLNGGVLHARRGPQANSALANVTVRNTLDFAGAGDFVLEDSTNLRIENSAANAITNYSSDRFVRTGASSGSLIRAIAPGVFYDFPVGTNDLGASRYSPVQFTPAAGGVAGRLGVRVAVGSKGGFPGAHQGLQAIPTASYLKRFWSLDSVTAQINGKFRFNYYDSDVVGTEASLDKMSRWRPVKQGVSGAWKVAPVPAVDVALNFFETDASYAFGEFEGDYTLGNQSAFRRIFYSRASGAWNDESTWTYSDTHSGPVMGLGIWPDNSTDSVVIGGGTLGVGNHVVTLNVPSTSVAGVSLGTPVYTGTLSTGVNAVESQYFNMSPGSTLRIGSPQGISALGSAAGNIRSTVTRNYSPDGIYEYNGAVNQIPGDGLPPSIRGLIISKPTGTDLTLDRSFSVTGYTRVDSGSLDLRTYSISAVGLSSGKALSIAGGARVKLGGAGNLLTAVPGYDDYSGIEANSFVEFYGDGQSISIVPAGISLIGLGNVDITGEGTKSCTGELLIRGNLHNLNDATFHVEDFKPLSLKVQKSVINEATFRNCGIIEIGQ